MHSYARILGSVLLLLLLSTAGLQAQRDHSWVNGLVFDESETHGVAGATVTLTGGESSPRLREVKLEAKTDGEGKYYFKDVAHGDYTFRVSAPGFVPYEIRLYIATDTLTALHVKLRKEAKSMSGDLSRIDHVILGVNDLQKGIEEFERRTGVKAVFGGTHPGRGTQNALASLGGSHYLEILAPNPADGGSTEWIGELRGLDKLTPAGWAAKGEDLPALQKKLKDQGMGTEEVRPGARNRPDGTRLAWKTLNFSPPAHALLPFFIEWDPASAHPSTTSPEGCRLTGFTLEDPAPDALRKPLQAAGVGVEVREGSSSHIRISLACPKGNVEF
jgi:glyoxalase-like protein/carboxypeptidase family protein